MTMSFYSYCDSFQALLGVIKRNKQNVFSSTKAQKESEGDVQRPPFLTMSLDFTLDVACEFGYKEYPALTSRFLYIEITDKSLTPMFIQLQHALAYTEQFLLHIFTRDYQCPDSDNLHAPTNPVSRGRLTSMVGPK